MDGANLGCQKCAERRNASFIIIIITIKKGTLMVVLMGNHSEPTNLGAPIWRQS